MLKMKVDSVVIDTLSNTSTPFDKTRLLKKITSLCNGLDMNYVNVHNVVEKVQDTLKETNTCQEIYKLSQETTVYLNTTHPDYGLLAGRIGISSLHKQTQDTLNHFTAPITTLYSFSNITRMFYMYRHKETQESAPLVAQDYYKFVQKYAKELDREIGNYLYDFTFDCFGVATLERSYLLRMIVDGERIVVERPQDLFMRTAVGIHFTNESTVAQDQALQDIIKSYRLMAKKQFIHASPTLFNAGTPVPQMSSCFLLDMKEDSIKGIYRTLSDCADISKCAGGIGISMHKIRARDTEIRGTNGISNGLVPMLKVYEATARYVDQGGGKRKGAFAIYLEPWHADIRDFLELKKNTGDESMRIRDLFYALWVPDLFMKRVRENERWSLFCPHKCKGLQDTTGKEFEALYTKYEREGLASHTMAAQDLFSQIMTSQMETGTPYMCYKDNCNAKSNQRHCGVIKSSNLCAEIIEYSSPDEIAVCNLASICLPSFVREDEHGNMIFDHRELYETTRVVTHNLNKIIDKNFYPVPEARNSNMRHRPIGIGIQGLADTFMKLRIAFDSLQASKLNREISETMYYAALSMSVDIAEKMGTTYDSYKGSPMSFGKLQPNLWVDAGHLDASVLETYERESRWNWIKLREKIQQFGVYNSLLIALMPTASTAQILGNNECMEPYTSNIYNRRVLAGEFPVINKHMVLSLIKLGLWNEDVKNEIIKYNGSIQDIECIPNDLKNIYKTVWEIKQRTLLDLSIQRGPYIDQSQSINVFLAIPTFKQLASLHMYAWKMGAKTGMYYLRSKSAADAIKFTIKKRKISNEREENINKNSVCRLNGNNEECLSCS
jgi:ribonucleoside-diphosphate reductase alpha chain